jgi:hypothetical protein
MYVKLSYEKLKDLIGQIRSRGLFYEYEFEKHRLIVFNENAQSTFNIRLPIHLPYPDLERLNPLKWVILLIQAGHGALGFMENDSLVDHKVISTYMVRKKQGKSQIKYLKTKGKSRAGSRLRLANTIRFFDQINHRLQTYFDDHIIDRIALSCSKTLLPYLFSSKVSCPFNKHDERIYRIPKDLYPPNFKVLKDTMQFLLKGEICFDPMHQQMVNELMAIE